MRPGFDVTRGVFHNLIIIQIEANRKLDFLYKRDALTGTYNRMAYFEMAETILRNCRILNQDCVVAFFDCVNKRFDDEGIQVSIGTCIMEADTPDEQKSLQDYLNMADQSMYENKRKKRILPL